MKKALQSLALILGAATIVGTGYFAAPSSAQAIERLDSNSSLSAQSTDGARGFQATVIVVTSTGSEALQLTDSKTTVNEILEQRGYKPENFKDEAGNAIAPEQRISNGKRFVVYSSGIEGKSETISLPSPEEVTESPELYEGQKVIDDPGTLGSALKTTISREAISRISPSEADEASTSDGVESSSTVAEQEVYLTVLSAPTPRKTTVGTKICNYEYICELLKTTDGLLELSSDYGHPLGAAHPWTTYSGTKSHDQGAVDFPVDQGTPIYSIAAGTVNFSGWESGGGGNTVIVEHEDGNYSVYAHMVEKSTLREDEEIKAGQLIGFVGSTGNSTGPHLHFEIFDQKVWGDGIPAYEYMKLHGVDLGACTGGPCELSKKDDSSPLGQALLTDEEGPIL